MAAPQVGERAAAPSLQPTVSEGTAPTPRQAPNAGQRCLLLRSSVGKTCWLRLGLWSWKDGPEAGSGQGPTEPLARLG